MLLNAAFGMVRFRHSSLKFLQKASLKKKKERKKSLWKSQIGAESNLARSSNWLEAQNRKSFASLFVHETRMRVGDTSKCLNLQFSLFRQTLMPCQMDKIRVNVCEELPKGPEQLLRMDVNNRLKCSETREKRIGGGGGRKG